MDKVKKEFRKCIFCDKDENVDIKGNCYVCENCRTLLIFEEISSNKLSDKINECLNSIQGYIDSKRDELHQLEQNKMCGKSLSEHEESIVEFCIGFQSVKLYLSEHIKYEGFDRDDINFRKNLYQLLDYSLKFNKLFGTDCFIFDLK